MNPVEEKEKAKWRKQKLLEIKAELKNNSWLKEYLMQTYPHSRESFIDEYAGEKIRWLEHGEQQKEKLEDEDLQFYHVAFKKLEEIQQKKLFDVQCQWRAEKLVIPEIKISFDFGYWERNILNCPFIEPITEHEIDLYSQYLLSNNYESQTGWGFSWQNYEEIKKAYVSENENANFPEWYDFHNGRTGSSLFMLLPDIRGEKEEFYLSLWRHEFHKPKVEKTNPSPVVPAEAIDSRPHINYHKAGWLSWFIQTFEDKKTQELFHKYGGEPWRRSNENYDENIWWDWKLLSRADKIIPIDGWSDWKEAIHRAADKYTIMKIAEALPFAYDKYLMNIETGLPFEFNDTHDHFPRDDDGFRKAILRGRELNHEPKDFDF